ncbi:MAG TPA: DUF72 domain-containing protein [Deinococcales bacterium]|nr:DUF72 domain-containing protein [Deinococcales bacterium]
MIRVGTASWTDPSLLRTEWYPSWARSDPRERLRYYAAHFDTVEVDSTYYALARPEVVERWARLTPGHFTFHVKAYSAFTGHGVDARALPADLRPLVGHGRARVPQRDLPPELVEEAWRRFLESIRPLEEAGKLGYLLFQLPPWIGPTQGAVTYLRRLRERAGGRLLAVEFRNRAWYERWERVLPLLRELNMAHVTVDAPRVIQCPPTVAVASHERLSVLRCHGRNGGTWAGPHAAPSDRFNWDYGDEEIDELADYARKLAEQAAHTYVIFNNNYGDQGQRNAASLVERLTGNARPNQQAALWT